MRIFIGYWPSVSTFASARNSNEQVKSKTHPLNVRFDHDSNGCTVHVTFPQWSSDTDPHGDITIPFVHNFTDYQKALSLLVS